MARSHSVPSYRLHKPSGQAVVRIRLADGSKRDIYLGKHNSPESHKEYARVIAEQATNQPGSLLALSGEKSSSWTLDQLLLAYWRHVEQHYRDSKGKPTTEVKEIKLSLAPLRELYGQTPVTEIGPRSLATVRQRMIDRGWCRTLINRRMDRVKRVFKWATSQELVPVSVYQSLRTLAGLQKGRTTVRESDPVKPVDPKHVEKTLPALNRHVRAMVEIQHLTGMRPAEVCGITIEQIDRTGEIWVYRPVQHKTAHRGKERVIPIGPRARAVLIAFLVRDKPPPADFVGIEIKDETSRLVAADAYQEAGRESDAKLLRDLARPVVAVGGCIVDPTATVFSPIREREERYRHQRENRKSKVPPSQQNRRKKSPKRVPSEVYHPHAYSAAIARAAKKAKVPHWHPHQLRHSFATDVRRAYGLEAAQVLLGHSRADVTQVYADRDLSLAVKVASERG